MSCTSPILLMYIIGDNIKSDENDGYIQIHYLLERKKKNTYT